MRNYIEQWKALHEDIMSRVNSSVVMTILERRGFDTTRAKVNGSGQISNVNCALHAGSDSFSFAATNEGTWVCPTRCGKGNLLSLMNGGNQPKAKEFKECLIEIADLVGVDTSHLHAGTPKRRTLEPLPKREPAKVEPVRDLKKLHPCIGSITTSAHALLTKRIPGLLKEDIEGMVLEGWIGSPSLAKDRSDQRGAYKTGKRGHELMLPMRSLEDSSKIAAAQYRWTREETPPNNKKTLLHHGSAGGEFGAVFGDIQEAIKGAEAVGHLVVTEGDMDTLTLAAMGVQYHVGIAGAARLPKVINYLKSISWTGKVIACVDRDQTGESVLSRAYQESKGSGIELLDGRPAKIGQDINDLFNEAGGGTQGSIAVMKLLYDAPHCKKSFPDEQDRAAEDKAKEEAELQAFLEKLPTINFDNSLHLNALKAKSAALQARRASFKQATPRLQRIFRKFAEDNEKLCWDLIRCFEISEVCNLPADLFAEAFSGMGLSPEWLEDARAKPIKLDDKKTIRKTSRAAYLKLKSDFWTILKAFAECIAQPILDTVKHLEVFQSVHISDKGFVEFAKFASPNYANKLEGLNNCATTRETKTLDDVTSEDHGKEIHTLVQTCHSSKCSGCQGFYIQQQYGYLRDSKDLWTKKMLAVRIAAEEDTPEATVKVWNKLISKMRGIEIRGAIHPTFKPLGIDAGLFAVMEDTTETKKALREAAPGTKIISMDGKQALHDFSFMVELSALRNREMIVLKDESLSTNKWLGRVKHARSAGKCDGFKWRSMRAWQEFRKPSAEESADNRPCKITLADIPTGFVYYEASSKDPIPTYHESCKLKNANEAIQRAKDALIIAQLGQLRGGLIVSKRRAIFEYQAAMKSGAEILDTLLC